VSTSDPRIGTVVGSYRVDSLLGRGGMGVVYLAEDQRSGTRGRKVALKILAPELSADERFRQRFERESQMAASLDHPNIVPVYEAGEVEGLLYIAMRYVEGEELRAFLQREGPPPPERALAIIGQVGAALDAAHARGLVHRDVKPGNILLIPGDDPDGPPHVYLTDFGLTKRADSHSGLTVTGQFVGTIEYVAPEQIEGKDVDHRTDVYALGCVLFEVLTGTPPFRADQDAAMLWAHLTQPPPKASERRPDLPLGLDDVLARAMAKDRDDRYGSCRELLAAARAALVAPAAPGATPVPAPPPPPPGPPPAVPAPVPAPATAPAGVQQPVQAGAPYTPSVPPSWPPAAPPPGPPRRRTGLLVGGIVAAVALVAAITVGIVLATSGGPGPSPTPPPTTVPPTTGTFPTEAESQLLGHVPPQLQTPACTRGSAPPAGAIAAVDCFTDTPQLMYYALFADRSAMDAAYQTAVATAGVTQGTGNCANGETSEDTWLDPEGIESGRLLCYLDGSTAVIVWTHNELLILAETRRPAGTIQQTYNFWTGIADHV
jgi:serine/threonine protein kinase